MKFDVNSESQDNNGNSTDKISTQKGLTLYELWFGEVELANRLKTEGKLDKEAHRQKLQAAFESLEESSKILRYEPENSLQGTVSLEANSMNAVVPSVSGNMGIRFFRLASLTFPFGILKKK